MILLFSNPQGIISCCHPLPSLVHQHVEDVHKLVIQAIENVPDIPAKVTFFPVCGL